jgi:NAD(P)-dependent dehydrogenase (short-subunit alcohol dehydrogenase family)
MWNTGLAMSSDRPAALVTGGGTRLGRRFALALAGRGYDIALHYNSSAGEAGEVANAVIELGGQCQLFQFDFSSGEDAGELILPVLERFPALNLLVNSASTYAPGTSTETSLQQLEQQFTVNFFAPYRLASSFAKQVSAGNIINILDNKIAFQQYHYSAYLLSKKALADFTRMAAIEFAPGIRVNGIAPGVVQPAETRSSDYIDWRIEGIPLAKKGEPGALIRAAEYLLDNDFVTGQILFVDGGESVDHVGRNSETYPAGGAN